jgi:N-acetylglutamate synthase-like GNAT family acetyltransferase
MDMLVKLYDLPPLDENFLKTKNIRRAMAYDKSRILQWIQATFSEGWVNETETAFSRQPISCFIASAGGNVTGFACYDVTAKGVFGPMGVLPEIRGGGLGRGLLLAALHDMRSQGYQYAIIGWVGPAEFYTKVVGATLIPGSEPQQGMFRGHLQHDAN